MDSGRVDSGQWTVDEWTVDEWTSGQWTVDEWTSGQWTVTSYRGNRTRGEVRNISPHFLTTYTIQLIHSHTGVETTGYKAQPKAVSGAK